jgi:hypothetical protein
MNENVDNGFLRLPQSNKYISDIVKATIDRGGATTKIDTQEFLSDIDCWVFPKYPQKTCILLPTANLVFEISKFISQNEDLFKDADWWLGTWFNPNNKQYHIDIVTIESTLEEACKMALEICNKCENKIIALYNPGLGESYYLYNNVMIEGKPNCGDSQPN